MRGILVIIIIYEKKILDLSIFKKPHAKKNHDIFIYDNSSSAQALPNIQGVKLHYTHDKKNSGVSKGYNEGILKAKELKKNYVLLLDQDTNFQLTDINSYIDLEKKYGDCYIYAPIVGKDKKIYSPFIDLNFVGKAQNRDMFEYQEIYPIQKKSLINSGLMIPLSITTNIGGFNDKIKLDFSDIYFIEKYKESHQSVILVNLWLEHSLSGDEGMDYKREINRFKFYCNGAKYLSNSINKSTHWTVFRRMLRLIQKYKTLRPVVIYTKYYLKDNVI